MKKAIDDLQHLIEEGCSEYEQTAPTVHTWLNDLYMRINEQPDEVLLSELLQVDRLLENGLWMQPNCAANAVYKLQDRLGKSTVGQAGF